MTLMMYPMISMSTMSPTISEALWDLEALEVSRVNRASLDLSGPSALLGLKVIKVIQDHKVSKELQGYSISSRIRIMTDSLTGLRSPLALIREMRQTFLEI